MKIKTLKARLAAALTLVAVTVLAGCGGNSSTSSAAKNDTLKMSISSEPDSFDPMISVAADTKAVMMNVFEGLLSFNEDGEFIPAIAESYEVKDGGLTYEFNLKKDIKFHDGKACTSKDVKYTYDKMAGLDGNEAMSSVMQNVISSVEAPDDYTVIIKLKEVDSGFLTKATTAIVEDGYDNNSKVPIGTGPYKFSDYIEGQKIILEKNNDYNTIAERTPSINKVEFKIMTDTNSVVMALKSGDLDIGTITAKDSEALEDSFNIVESPQNMVQLMAFNDSIKPFNDVRVRQAINYAVDKDEIITNVMKGRGTKVQSFLSPIMKEYYNGDITGYSYDTEKAKELLKEAGYENGFEFTLTVPSNYQEHVDTAQIIKDELSKVNITVNIQLVEWAQWLENVYKNADYEATIIAHNGKLDPQDFLNRFNSSYSKNYYKYSNAQYDKLMLEASQTTDESKRAELYKECQKVLSDDAAAVFIQDPSINLAAKKNIQGIKSYPVKFFDISSMKFEE